jgi:predicted choloylglycine hydrolase
MKKKLFWFIWITLTVLVSVPILLFLLMLLVSKIKVPEGMEQNNTFAERMMISENAYAVGNNWLRKSESGLWEMYVEGKPYERGVISGRLCKELIHVQENAFVAQIHQIIPSDFYLHFLKYFIRFFDRNLDNYIPPEYLEEIYGISQSASDEFGYIGNKYERILNYHAAHDIGHALEEYNMVGCSSFGVWGGKSKDSSLLIGRNFDFYVGDDFAKNKIVAFYNPDKGYKFVSVTWASMMGCMSGMNEKGLTVTINAAKSVVPRSAATPISIIVREILQYASNIDEAYKIASSRQSFVSEILMIGSANDNKVALIEKTPEQTELYLPGANYIQCSNHFQSAALKKDELNQKNIAESSSGYRFEKLDELIRKYPSIDYQEAAGILRDQKGLNGADIGYSNEKSLNQLICHHSVIFKPSELKVWISTAPYQLGRYVCYDLKKIFNMNVIPKGEIYETNLMIKPDTFLTSESYMQFLRYKYLSRYLRAAGSSGAAFHWNEQSVNDYISTNSSYFLVYEQLGDYFKKNNEIASALKYYNLALSKEIPLKIEVDRIKDKLETTTQ